LFGLEHCYKGSAGVAQTFVIALIANGVFIWRKSLIPVAIAHAGMVTLLPII
jgi:membrane protease YdiL (CAAX protease family)